MGKRHLLNRSGMVRSGSIGPTDAAGATIGGKAAAAETVRAQVRRKGHVGRREGSKPGSKHTLHCPFGLVEAFKLSLPKKLR